jgi:RNA polymerase sigma factor (sigma-70 family)
MPKELKSDYLLWKSFINGNEDGFYLLYDQYVDVLLGYGLHFSKDKDFIKDCIHDLFLDLYKYREKLSNTDNIRFYLLRSLRRKIYREKGKLISLVLEENINMSHDKPVLAFEETIIDGEIQNENYKILANALNSLSARQREGLSLKFEHNLTYSEIADIQGISVESVRTSIYRALKDLRASIEATGKTIYLLHLLSKKSIHLSH